MTEILKAAQIAKLELDETELAAINRYTIKELGAEDVFVFRVAACSNEIDRDFEVFPRKTLEELAPLMEGKTVVSDHARTADSQKARVYRAAVEDAAGKTKTGEPYARLVLSCYMVRTESNRDSITEIEAGINREVSIACSVGAAVCSICGQDNTKVSCEHISGRAYDGALCYRRLENAKDAYEISFVAIPAQPDAGVIKSYGGKPGTQPEPQTPEPTAPPAQTKPKTVAEKIAAAFKQKTEE